MGEVDYDKFMIFLEEMYGAKLVQWQKDVIKKICEGREYFELKRR